MNLTRVQNFCRDTPTLPRHDPNKKNQGAFELTPCRLKYLIDRHTKQFAAPSIITVTNQ